MSNQQSDDIKISSSKNVKLGKKMIEKKHRQIKLDAKIMAKQVMTW